MKCPCCKSDNYDGDCLICGEFDKNFNADKDLADYRQAKVDAENLFRSLCPQCELADSLTGIISQISNWCAGAKEKEKQNLEFTKSLAELLGHKVKE